MGESTSLSKSEELVDLPPGFRFHPTDEEIIIHYLMEKVIDHMFSCVAIGEADLNKSEPWDLPKKAKMGEKEWFFFCQRDRKYPTGTRTNRATESGYWKATGKDKEIIHKDKGCLVGMKKTLVFYKGRAPKGQKTDWVMNEYRLEGKLSQFNIQNSAKDEWVVCRVYNKGTAQKKNPFDDDPNILRMMDHQSIDINLLDHYSSLPPLISPSTYNLCQPGPSYSAQAENKLKAAITTDPQHLPNSTNSHQPLHHPQNPMQDQIPINNLYPHYPNLSYLQQTQNTPPVNTALPGQNNLKQKNVLSYNRSFDDIENLEDLWSF